MHEAIEPIAFDYVKFIIVRAGSALLFSEYRFIHGRTSVNNHAVGRHAAARAHDHEIINAQLRRAHRDGRFTLDPLGFVGQKRSEGVERRSGLGERTHLDPVPEQHNDHQQREFPPEFELVMQQPGVLGVLPRHAAHARARWVKRWLVDQPEVALCQAR